MPGETVVDTHEAQKESHTKKHASAKSRPSISSGREESSESRGPDMSPEFKIVDPPPHLSIFASPNLLFIGECSSILKKGKSSRRVICLTSTTLSMCKHDGRVKHLQPIDEITGVTMGTKEIIINVPGNDILIVPDKVRDMVPCVLILQKLLRYHFGSENKLEVRKTNQDSLIAQAHLPKKENISQVAVEDIKNAKERSIFPWIARAQAVRKATQVWKSRTQSSGRLSLKSANCPSTVCNAAVTAAKKSEKTVSEAPSVVPAHTNAEKAPEPPQPQINLDDEIASAQSEYAELQKELAGYLYYEEQPPEKHSSRLHHLIFSYVTEKERMLALRDEAEELVRDVLPQLREKFLSNHSSHMAQLLMEYRSICDDITEERKKRNAQEQLCTSGLQDMCNAVLLRKQEEIDIAEQKLRCEEELNRKLRGMSLSISLDKSRPHALK